MEGALRRPIVFFGVLIVSIYLLTSMILLSMLQSKFHPEKGLRISSNTVPAESKSYQHNWENQGHHETVVTIALGYSLQEYHVFVGSLRHTGYRGNIILGLQEDAPANVVSYLVSQRCIIKYISFVDCKDSRELDNKCLASYTETSRYWVRFRFIADWLESCDACTGPILFSEFGNIYFQANPFASNIQIFSDLYLFEDGHFISDYVEVNNTLFMCKAFKWNIPSLSLSVMLGERGIFLQYLHTLMREVRKWDIERTCNRHQEASALAAHNYMFYDGKVTAHIYSFDNTASLSNDAKGIHTQVALWVSNQGVQVPILRKLQSKSEMEHFPFVTADSESRYLESPYESLYREINGVSFATWESKMQSIGL